MEVVEYRVDHEGNLHQHFTYTTMPLKKKKQGQPPDKETQHTPPAGFGSDTAIPGTNNTRMQTFADSCLDSGVLSPAVPETADC
jgi:hypothetical protein